MLFRDLLDLLGHLERRDTWERRDRWDPLELVESVEKLDPRYCLLVQTEMSYPDGSTFSQLKSVLARKNKDSFHCLH